MSEEIKELPPNWNKIIFPNGLCIESTFESMDSLVKISDKILKKIQESSKIPRYSK